MGLKPYQHLLPGFRLIFRATRTTRSGRVLAARDYGYRAWPMVIWSEAEPNSKKPSA